MGDKMKKIAIMQPYLFPYIGYFQLIQAVESFVVYDDVNFIKQGWINRNNILLEGKCHRFTLNLIGASSFKRINDIQIGNNKWKIYKTIATAYNKAPFYKETMTLLEDIFTNSDTNLAMFLYQSLKKTCDYLGIRTRFIMSSEMEKNNELTSQRKVIHICSLLNADEYINAIGGISLYSSEHFLLKNIRLKFLKTKDISYDQGNRAFIGNLSIIDVMMFNSKEDIKNLLKEYELIES